MAAVELGVEEAEGVLARALDLVHRRVGVAGEVLGGGAVAREERDADADRGAELALAQPHRGGERLQHLARDHLRVLGLVDVRQQHGELVAAEAGEGVAAAQRGRQPARDRTQQQVALGVAEGVVDQLEAVDVDEHDCERAGAALRLRDRELEAILEQHPVGQVGELVVVGLEGDDLLGALALGDVARDAVEADHAAVVLLRDHRDAGQRNGHAAALAAAVAPRAQAQLDVKALAGQAARLAEQGVDAVEVLGHHQGGEGALDEGAALVAEQGLDARVDVGEASAAVEREDHVGGALHQIAVEFLRILQALAHQLVGAFERALVQGAIDRTLQLRDVVGLAHVVVGAAAQCADGRVDRVLAADDDHRLVALVVGQPVEQGEAVGVGQAVVEQDQRVALLLQAADRLGDAAAFVEESPGAGEHVRKGAAQGRIVIDDQDAHAVGVVAGTGVDPRPEPVFGRSDHGSRRLRGGGFVRAHDATLRRFVPAERRSGSSCRRRPGCGTAGCRPIARGSRAPPRAPAPGARRPWRSGAG